MEFRDLKKQYQVLKDKIDNAILEAASNGHYIMGEQVNELEEALAEYVGRKYCVSCANGTDALSLCLTAYGIGRGDVVFVPDFTFFASAEVIAAAGAIPFFVDININTFNLEPQSLKDAIKRAWAMDLGNLKAVIAVDLFGLTANYDDIIPICKQNDLILIEDGAQGFGGSLHGKRACSFGDISTTSFFPAKPLGCYGDGGAVFTDDEDKANLIRSLKFHGKGEDKYDNVRVGGNSRLDTLQAAILLVKFAAFKEYELNDVNNIADAYTARLNNMVITPTVPNDYYSSWAQYTILLDNKNTRDALRAHLTNCKIPTMIYFPKPMHSQKAFEYLNDDGEYCKETSRACDTALSLPMGPYLDKIDQKRVCDEIIAYLKK